MHIPGYPQRFIYLHGPQDNVAAAKKMVREYVESAADVGASAGTYTKHAANGQGDQNLPYDYESGAVRAGGRDEGNTLGGDTAERGTADGHDQRHGGPVSSGDVRVGTDGLIKQQV